MKNILLAIIISFSLPALAVENVSSHEAYVTHVGTFGDGGLWIFLDTTVNISGCALSRLDIAPNHPEIDTWQRIAQEALITRKKVFFQARGYRTFNNNGIIGSYPTLDNSTYSWFGLAN